MSSQTLRLGEVDGPLLIFGGPYSNLQATQAIKSKAESLGIPPGQTICTGDIIAYCGDPVDTLDLIRDWGVHVVMGNCEESLGEGALDCGCGFETGSTCSLLSVDWYRFALGKINEGQKEWMRALPSRIDLTCRGRKIAIVHGSPDRMNRFIFPSTSAKQKERELQQAQADIVVGGHSGIPFGQLLDGQAWLNSGVIGMPANDGTRNGWYLLLETNSDGIRASWYRLAYDAEAASTVMTVQGLRGGYQDTLLNGLWPSQDVLPEAERKQQGLPLAPQPLHLQAKTFSPAQ